MGGLPVLAIPGVGERIWTERFTFAFVRNPWDRTVSFYHYLLQTRQGGVAEQSLSFENWVRLVFAEQDPRYRSKKGMFLPQTAWVTDEQGYLIVDFVDRFEHDFHHVCGQIGQDRKLPHKNKSIRGYYRSYYTDETATNIRDYFAADIERFNYTF